jgi:hypothetical protein
MITSLPSAGSTITFEHASTVRLNNKVIGQIKLGSDNQWRYYPKGSKTPGEAFSTLEECQRSLQ